VSDQNPQPIQEEALDKMIELVEGPMNTVGEKLLSSKIVLAPLSLSLDLTFRAMARLMGRKQK
jgi:hypothetical protein